MLSAMLDPTVDEETLIESRKVSSHVALVTLNRPAVCNAVNSAMARQMLRTIGRLEADPEIRAVVLTGAGDRAFCAGADLHEIGGQRGWNMADGPAGFCGFIHAERSKPWIAAVRGAALGGGTEIALACDMIVAGTHASFGLPEVRRSLVPTSGGLHRLPRAMPRNIAIEMILTGEPISAQRALETGLINHLVDDDHVISQACELAESVARGAPQAVREALRLLRMSENMSEADLARHTVRAIGKLMHTDDFREGPRAFFESRQPRWTGA